MKTCIVCKGFISEPNKSNDLADGLHICDLCNARVDAYKAKINLYIHQVAVNQKDADHEPLYNRKTLLYVCHEMAVAMIPQLSNGVAVCYDYNIIIDAAIDKAMAE